MANTDGQTVVSDPNYPLIQLPAEYETQRSTCRLDLEKDQGCALIDTKGPGAVRHFWIVAKDPEALQIEITCDDAQEPQVKMSLHQFFGVLFGKDPYRIESAPIKLLPAWAYSSYFPIPFQSSCRMTLRNTSAKPVGVWSMVNWQKYDRETVITPYRFHARFSSDKPAGPFGMTLLGCIGGKGFVAGLFHGIIQHDKADLIWHTGGDTWLIDGETNPHVLRGIGAEDLFGYGFGIYADMSQWVGGPHIVGNGPSASEVVTYRFFGPDSVRFSSSLSLRIGTRANDIENVLYYYKDHSTEVPKVESPETWTLCGPFDVTDYARFEQEELPQDVEKGTTGEWSWGRRKLSALQIKSEHTWVDFARWYRRNQGGNTGTQPDTCAAYASTVIPSQEERQATLCLGFDDWIKIWLNGQPVTTLRHDNGFRVSEVPVTLKKGDNRLVIRLSNFDNVEWRCWAFSCVIRDAEQNREFSGTEARAPSRGEENVQL